MKIVIGTKIKERRQQHEWSQQTVAERLHVSRQTISKWELGKSYPDLELLVALSKLFSVSTDELLGLSRRPVQRPWWQLLLRKRSRTDMTVKWYSGGQDRARVAVGIISDLVANLNTTNEQPLRQLLATYYQELLEQRTGSVLGVFDRMNLDISKCLRQQQIKLSPENEQLMQQLVGLNMIYYR
ncbi:helix-turn-helix domain-containing protein [Lactiplantibacillus plantarum]|uniref:helix-turn-helix domain-containing protein n=1 Tax=Lactiplantibacillus plantarum TaxID=1590 RepID=UPI001BAA2421|nr:helix-turn-helix domain-containing protein [Lactiplantibacillus plantarum]MBS0950575.1 helix-turn-helix domain-containing protein [Lactiplantibacillus plantarum]